MPESYACKGLWQGLGQGQGETARTGAAYMQNLLQMVNLLQVSSTVAIVCNHVSFPCTRPLAFAPSVCISVLFLPFYPPRW